MATPLSQEPIVRAIARLVKRGDLDHDAMTAATLSIVVGAATPAQIGAFLAALRAKGETAVEIEAAVRVVRDHAIAIRPSRAVLDTCGTGGDGHGTFNISTAAAFVLAGAGVPVAKHGNRAVSSATGSADVLEALGVRIDLSPEQTLACVEEIGIGFLFAPTFHGALRHAAGARRETGFRSLFNLVGPLANPAGAAFQVLGVFDAALTGTLARVLQSLGAQAAMVVAGKDGLDEISPSGPTVVGHLAGGRVHETEVVPEDAGLERVDLAELTGGDAPTNARIIRGVLSGSDRGACRTAVVLNAAAGFLVAGRAHAWPVAARLAASSIDSGGALAALEALAKRTVRC